jgi:putative transcriptional regulator
MPKLFQEALQTTVGEKRRAADLSQQQLAEMVHVSRQTIIAIEKGNYSPTVTLALKIARVLGARVEDLFFYE